MKTLKVRGHTNDSLILINEKLENLQQYIQGKKVVIITDTNVKTLYHNKFPECNVITIPTGEKIKTLETIQYIIDELIKIEADRSFYIVGIGGGIVCDISGFAASIYMRGLKFGFVSTTLLSQVDASVGGKNGVNYAGYKNMLGVFNQPEFVICDINLLSTLPEEEILCGFAEIVKHAVIADPDMFLFLEENHQKALALDREIIEKLVFDSVLIKSEIVNKDERELGERKKLNFGHTIAHSLEKITGIPHGEAVSAGMIAASALSIKHGLLSPEYGKRIESLLENLKLPTRIPADRERILWAMRKDKKRQGDMIDFVLLQGIGKAVIKKISIKELDSTVL
jgi:3-dehydroquinate synthase